MKFAFWSLDQDANFFQGEGPAPRMLEVLGREIGLTADQMLKLNAHRPAIREDRETLQRCHQYVSPPAYPSARANSHALHTLCPPRRGEQHTYSRSASLCADFPSAPRNYPIPATTTRPFALYYVAARSRVG